MSNETPGKDAVPGWGQPSPQPQPDEPTAPWPPAEPPATPWPVEADAPATPDATPPAPDAPWGTTPEPPPAAPAPTEPVAPLTWTPSEPETAAPSAPAAPWTTTPGPAPVAPVAPVAPGTWGAPAQPAPQAAPPPQQQPAPGGWGAAPAQQQPGWGAAQQPGPQQPGPQQPGPQQPPGGWGPQQPQGGWGQGAPGAPGGPPVGWAPAPAQSGGNGCLKGCLIVGAIGVVLVVILGIAITVLGFRFAQDLGIDPTTGDVAECPLISNSDLAAVLGSDSTALPLGGIVDATIGQLLDKRVIPDAEDCWIAGSHTGSGRIARQSGGDAAGTFRSALDKAKADGYFAGAVSGVGDEAFCTGMSDVGSFGVLVRSGDRLAYISLIGSDIGSSNYDTNADGVVVSPETCQLGQEVAAKVLR